VLDTVKIRSPYITEATARAVGELLQRRTCTNLATGEVMYEFTSGPLSGTWDHRISVQVERQEYRSVDTSRLVETQGADTAADGRAHYDQKRSRRPVLMDSPPYLLVECSAHKALLGHNVYGGPLDLVAPVCWLVDQVAAAAGVELANGASWIIRRIDWAECFDLGGFEANQEYMGYLRNAEYPRRKVSRFGLESLHIAGTTSSVKIYCKGPEFAKHDRKRCSRHTDVDSLQKLANTVLRCETEIHARTIDEEFGPGPAVGTPSIVQWVKNLHDRDIGQVLREGTSAVLTVRTAVAVKRRLYEIYGSRQATALWGTWLELSALGEKSAASRGDRVTFWRHRKLLTESGCSWHGGDVKLDTSVRLVPADFTPQRHDPRRLTEEAEQIVLALASYRLSA